MPKPRRAGARFPRGARLSNKPWSDGTLDGFNRTVPDVLGDAGKPRRGRSVGDSPLCPAAGGLGGLPLLVARAVPSRHLVSRSGSGRGMVERLARERAGVNLDA